MPVASEPRIRVAWCGWCGAGLAQEYCDWCSTMLDQQREKGHPETDRT